MRCACPAARKVARLHFEVPAEESTITRVTHGKVHGRTIELTEDLWPGGRSAGGGPGEGRAAAGKMGRGAELAARCWRTIGPKKTTVFLRRFIGIERPLGDRCRSMNDASSGHGHLLRSNAAAGRLVDSVNAWAIGAGQESPAEGHSRHGQSESSACDWTTPEFAWMASRRACPGGINPPVRHHA